MTKPISDYTTDELSEKIKAIKAERERTENALKRYEEELERRKDEKWLPLNEEINFTLDMPTMNPSYIEIKAIEEFSNHDSLYKYLSALQITRKAWFANYKGEQIDIKVLKPLLMKGWVAFCPISRSWFWTNTVPKRGKDTWETVNSVSWIGGFNLKPAENWKTSLMECGL